MVASSPAWISLIAALSVETELPLPPAFVKCLIDVGTFDGEEINLRNATLADGQTVTVSIGYPVTVRISNRTGPPPQISVSVGLVGSEEDSIGHFVVERTSNPSIIVDLYGVVTTDDEREVEFDYLTVDCRLMPTISPHSVPSQ